MNTGRQTIHGLYPPDFALKSLGRSDLYDRRSEITRDTIAWTDVAAPHRVLSACHGRAHDQPTSAVLGHNASGAATLSPWWPFSLLGRVVEHDVLDRYPELGGFKVLAVGPGLTMTDKLLAQTGVAMSRLGPDPRPVS